ncbi:MAG: hypothetical protein CFE21_04220 [Bacteroidetes bacterium B1(2017)]|nr:MAG: hypothetical protein CFE21_04220 [Bacteroidetes bacterium B1(2017)]
MNKLLLYIGISCFVLLSSCKKDSNIEGPELVDIFGEFKVLEPLKGSATTANFANGDIINYHCKLSIRTNWTIEVIGLNSGARKVYTGNAKDFVLNPVLWDGTISFAPFFRKNEPCVARMAFEEYSDTLYSDTLTITDVRPTPSVDILIDDFESPQRPYNTFTEGQQAFNGTSVNYQGVSPAEKTRFYVLSGNHGPSASLFLCGMNLTAKISQGTGENYFKFSTDNPKKVYFNAYVYGWGDNKAEMSIEFQEDDNMDGIYQPAEEGAYTYRFPVTWTGWKLVSFTYDDTKISTSGGFGNSDRTGHKDLDRIIATQFLLLAQPGTSGSTRVGLDYCSFTYFKPFTP